MPYIPVLRAKRGEIDALRSLSSDVSQKIRPLFLTEEDTPQINYEGECYVLGMRKELEAENRIPAITLQDEKTGKGRRALLITADELDLDLAKYCDEQTDLLINVGDLTDYRSAVSFLIRAIVEVIGKFALARSFAVLGTSTVRSMAELEKGVTRLPRLEWDFYRELLSKAGRRIDFGDFTTRHPEAPAEFQPFMKPGAKIRYTGEKETVIIKGGSVQTSPGYEQFYDLSKLLTQQPEYKGATYSWGDKRINDASEGIGTPGNLTTWISVEANHHITLVVDQLSSFGEL